ncbi:MarR family transcriptional regulator [Gordonia sp. ABSL1-1]|uniref:MarR family winged helix-turn-helix transcriptional regulator n=1 Tax=Gordonia sp. ABSL1-1 TaxID=3053923 RepID=UPI002572D638|nr:MarR family transcriptional regulator [Gordonia sp. ABSL1-1]MDL9936858.1 MarR family transcriptional regulator [Gordonia sp. ABSL1-1]
MNESSAPAATPSVDDASAVLIDFLDRLACLGKSQAMDSLAASDLTLSQLKVVFALGAHDEPMSVNEVAEHVHLSLAAAGRTVDKLVVSNLVDRREDSADRRVKRVSLTDEGRAFVDSQLSVKEELVRGFVAGLPAPVCTDLLNALRPIVDSAVDYFDLGPPAP